MDTRQTTQSPSLISTLADRRDAIYDTAEAENRDLTVEEETEAENLNSAIANSSALTERDAAIQLELARGPLECWDDGVGTPEGLAMAHAALRSARSFLSGEH
jgi:hypothetical protein